MPLTLRKRPDRPHFEIRGTYHGQHIERSSGTGKRAVALQVLRQIERQIERGEFAAPDSPTFASAALDYMKTGGERTYIKQLLEYFGGTPLSQIDQAAVDAAAETLYPAGSPATRNRQVYTPICAILRRAGARLDLRRPSGAGGNRQTGWLRPDQAFALIEEAKKLDPTFGALLTVLLYTGMRLGEALGLTWENMSLAEGFALLPKTKNNEPRTVFLPNVAVAAISGLERRANRVFKFSKGGHLYSLLKASAFRAGVDLPERSAFHLFRHTWASWMRRYAGVDTKGLVATGAWKDTKSAERYAHAVVTEEAQKAALLPTPRKRA